MSIAHLDRAYVTLSSKGQVTIPKSIRDEMKLEPGSQLRFVHMSDGRVELIPRTGSMQDLIGILHDPNRKPISIDEMNDAIADGWATAGARGMRGLDPDHTVSASDSNGAAKKSR
ncbi:AbrB/MazE/SpoVT family DNA-binding domain-containing protein [Leucobacter viscericola]|uniref:AbrB/MazE/SpoVT family DNA-binding domain-containing protein n=1 Tax=Leucobacter viscericola TaxID=2714935 RepID=A0A6G7XFZ9_9MICO|nr:AbrB/MazE/SpoVT family DNA-binding domain-containing protein [Leucobacter viscericola]QIK63485.1 AbrB/MazE/SpoVT family DNA-binding domain-containing protein [Leucobacter viscericola]